jgi:N-acetylmuramate 1-kinase
LQSEIQSALSDYFQEPELKLSWLAGDGSDRKYYRLERSKSRPDNGFTTAVIMLLSGPDADKLKQEDYEWIAVAQTMREHDIRVPEVYDIIKDQQIIAIEDYGNITLQNRVNELLAKGDWESVKSLYLQCFKIVFKMLSIPMSAKQKWMERKFDFEKLHWELRFFNQEFTERFLKDKLSTQEFAELEREFVAIAKRLGSETGHFVHRDFHSRNLMLIDQTAPAVIDFQDARDGNIYYDALSLIFDAYVDFTEPQRRELLQCYLDSLQENHYAIDHEVLALTLLQRQIKAIGSFAYLTVSKNRGDYLKHVRPAIAAIKSTIKVIDFKYPTTAQTLLNLMERSEF